MIDYQFYQGIRWSEETLFTIRNGIPAWGSGHFEFGTAQMLCCLSWLGFSGMHRVYLGDIFCGIAFCLTSGFCRVGDIMDQLSLQEMVDKSNTEIDQKVRQRQEQLGGLPPVQSIYGQPPGLQSRGGVTYLPLQQYPPQGPFPPSGQLYPPQALFPPPNQQYSPPSSFPPPGQQYPLQDSYLPQGSTQLPQNQANFPPQQANFPPQQANFPPQQANFPPQNQQYPASAAQQGTVSFPPPIQISSPSQNQSPNQNQNFF